MNCFALTPLIDCVVLNSPVMSLPAVTVTFAMLPALELVFVLRYVESRRRIALGALELEERDRHEDDEHPERERRGCASPGTGLVGRRIGHGICSYAAKSGRNGVFSYSRLATYGRCLKSSA